ncbi:Non-specific serine/threonine protein kinase [Methanococcus vannielii SB]|jgi:fibrillarin-like pre-rRNA processing protein|uniref:Fibrillarin-like rRNA/tRNA 2'-O-methyltransferase n=1 Tax=Methanococcus vannielii (strain ATCC 35089 / DSM 1224 / JCM 13029 / OCM 148 / SB) TaxID=406327 RepID=FLPA_METVS|nr:fibrillarin-like rRNA/tRNA 2'-O-methyltransferase [Methanococcus vannielii]P35552.1 RecName: Full=Fibrillarin-like rRNA/tRNA 2'-O-methyltransferase [Methanococcus vannielii SB]ABR55363.1 Non-specific serine/threonine protein kinase [Methanococcus vannielii SB]CAA52165.1 pre-rRNA processing protein [Methanococcus vannielii]
MEKIKVKEIFSNVYGVDLGDGLKRIATKSLAPGKRVYGEKLIYSENKEYRIWNPNKSKLGAAIINGLKKMPIKKGTKVLYLGASAGTTPSHVSDISEDTIVYAVEFAPRIMREFIDSCNERINLIPILGDANRPFEYSNIVGKVDVIFEDVAQPNQAEILVKNAKWFLNKDGYAMISIKARSIDVTKNPKEIFLEQKKILIEGGFDIVDEINIEPFEKDHIMFVGIWKGN